MQVFALGTKAAIEGATVVEKSAKGHSSSAGRVQGGQGSLREHLFACSYTERLSSYYAQRRL